MAREAASKIAISPDPGTALVQFPEDDHKASAAPLQVWSRRVKTIVAAIVEWEAESFMNFKKEFMTSSGPGVAFSLPHEG